MRALLTAVAATAIGVGAAQVASAAQVSDPVTIDVSVVRSGQPVRGLSADDFVVTDNGVQQKVETTPVDRQPVTVLMTLDTSQNLVGEKIERLREAARGAIAALKPTDLAALISFSHEVNVRVAPTEGRDSLQQAVADLQAGGGTSVRDALFVAMQTPVPGPSRPVVLLYADGADTTSWLSEKEIVEAVRRGGATVHAVTLEPQTSRQPEVVRGGFLAVATSTPRTFSSKLAAASGGRVWPGASIRDVGPLLVRALEEMRTRYTLTYRAEGVKRDGWHEVKVRLRSGSADVAARPGYFVAARK